MCGNCFATLPFHYKGVNQVNDWMITFNLIEALPSLKLGCVSFAKMSNPHPPTCAFTLRRVGRVCQRSFISPLCWWSVSSVEHQKHSSSVRRPCLLHFIPECVDACCMFVYSTVHPGSFIHSWHSHLESRPWNRSGCHGNSSGLPGKPASLWRPHHSRSEQDAVSIPPSLCFIPFPCPSALKMLRRTCVCVCVRVCGCAWFQSRTRMRNSVH